MKIIFLDVDGVLNNIHTIDGLLGKNYLLEESKLQLLKQLVDLSGAELVLSSHWRSGWSPTSPENVRRNRIDIENSQGYFMLCAEMNDFGLNFLSEIPRFFDKKREDEINYWITNWPGKQIKEYVILDDEARYFSQDNKHLVLTSIDIGLTQKDVDKALRILKAKEKKRILVVDDIEVNRAVIIANLDDEYEIFEAEEGISALEVLNKESIDLVITDIQMPEMNGLELIKKIRADSKYDHIPIIANTKHGEMNQEESILEAGANDFVYKLSTPRIMKVRVQNLLR